MKHAGPLALMLAVFPGVLGGGLSAVALTWSPAATAASSAEQIAGARALAQQGSAAFSAQKWQEAFDFFQRAESLYHAPPHLLYMARACEKLGRLVEAREFYNALLRESLPEGAPPAFRAAQESGALEIAELEPRLPQVTVSLEGERTGGVRVLANRKEIPPALLGVPRPMDPGDYEFTVESEVLRAEAVRVTVAEGAGETVVLRLLPRTSAPVASGTPDVVESSDGGGSRIPAYLAFGVGAIGLGFGTAFSIDHFSKAGESDRLFVDGGCDRDGACTEDEQTRILELSSASASSGTLGLVGFGVGAAALGTGLVLWFLAPESSSTSALADRSAPHVRPLVGVSSVGVAGRF